MKITLLGARKTILLKRLLREQNATLKFGVIVNDLSELELDEELIWMGHCVSEEKGMLISLHNSSISDGKWREFEDTLQQTQQQDAQHVIVETSGGCHLSVNYNFGQAEIRN